jgi:hypothetical protein
VADGCRVCLLEVEPELAGDLDEVSRAEAARVLVLPAVELGPGAWSVAVLRGAAGLKGRPIGMLVVDGVLLGEVRLGGRSCARLFFGGDLVLLADGSPETLAVRWSWSSLAASRVVVLDERVLAVGLRWPGIARRLYRRAAREVEHGFVLQAIAQLPRVEERLVALFWCIAERRGRMHPDGVHVRLSITHEALGDMIGARRPTVSLALKALAADGVLVRDGDRWILSADSVGLLADGRAPAARPGGVASDTAHTEPASRELLQLARDVHAVAGRERRRGASDADGPALTDDEERGDPVTSRPGGAAVCVLEVSRDPVLAPDAGHVVHVVADAPEALATLDSLAADVVVAHASALSEPCFVGRLLGRLRNRPALRHTKLLIVADGPPVPGPVGAAADEVVNAPVDPAWLLARVDAAATGAAAGDARGQRPRRDDTGTRETRRS